MLTSSRRGGEPEAIALQCWLGRRSTTTQHTCWTIYGSHQLEYWYMYACMHTEKINQSNDPCWHVQNQEYVPYASYVFHVQGRGGGEFFPWPIFPLSWCALPRPLPPLPLPPLPLPSANFPVGLGISKVANFPLSNFPLANFSQGQSPPPPVCGFGMYGLYSARQGKNCSRGCRGAGWKRGSCDGRVVFN